MMMIGTASQEDYWCPAGEGGDSVAATGVSGDDWIALLKIANGDWSIPADDLECLLERKLIEIASGFVRLTRQGEIALGLPV